MVTCTVQKVGRKSVQEIGCVDSTPQYHGLEEILCMKISLQDLEKQQLVAELSNYIFSYINPWTKSTSHSKPLSGTVSLGPLRRVS